MVAVALTIGLVLLLAIVKVVLERTDYQARDQDDWI
jgi:Tfp pilus assembly protein PilW